MLSVGDLERYSIRDNYDEKHRWRLKGRECISKAYREDFVVVLEIVDVEMKLFYVASETFLGIKYRISLQTYFYNCSAQQSTCKHIIGLQLIKEKFPFVPHSTEVEEEQMDEVYFLSMRHYLHYKKKLLM